MSVVLAVDDAARLRGELEDLRIAVVADLDPEAPARLAAAGDDLSLPQAEILLVAGRRQTLTADLVALCVRRGIRLVALVDSPRDARRATSLGVAWASADGPAEEMVRAYARESTHDGGRVIAVWGAPGAPGRTTVAIELALELSRDGRRVVLVDADTHAPAVALMTGLADEGPGFAAACRYAERDTLSPGELTRIALPLGDIEVLAGINRPSRWPELSAARVSAALEACRGWADDIVVDVAAPLEAEEEITSDLEGPRRNAATRAVIESADLIVAVTAADPVSISRFLRAHANLRHLVGSTPVRVVVNKTRGGAIGVDARGQIRRSFDRYAGVRDVWFLPWDLAAVDAAMLSGRPPGLGSARSALVAGVRRFVGEAIEPPLSRRRERGRAEDARRSA